MRHDLGGPPGFAVSQARQILRQDLTVNAKLQQVTCTNMHALPTNVSLQHARMWWSPWLQLSVRVANCGISG